MNFRKLVDAIILLLLLAPSAMYAQEKDQFPIPFGPNNFGNEFYFAMPVNWGAPQMDVHYVRLYMVSPVRTTVSVWAGGQLKETFETIPNEIRTVDLTPEEAQMFVRDADLSVPDDSIYSGGAVHIHSDDPIAVYVMNRTSYISDGLLLLPVNALGRNYIVASSAMAPAESQKLPSQYLIAAPYDGTEVTIRHPHRTPNHQAGETFTIGLDRGDVFSAMTFDVNSDMSGVTISASKPVAVTAGIACGYVPNALNFCCCDHLTEMMLPAESWGRNYMGIPFATRKKGAFYRVFAREADTRIYINGVEYDTLAGVGGEEGTGWLEYRAPDMQPVHFRADKPIAVFQYNTGSFYDEVPSDPFYMALTPEEQFASELFFSTPGDDFTQNYLNIIAEKDDFYELEMADAAQMNWNPVWKDGNAGIARDVPEKVDGVTYVAATLEIHPGVYRIRGRKKFAAYAYGKTRVDSYGFPAAAYTGDRDIDAPAPPDIAAEVTPCNGDAEIVVTSKAKKKGVVVPLSVVALVPPATDNYRIEGESFQPGISSRTNFSLKLADPSKDGVAVLAAADAAGNVTFDTIRYAVDIAGDFGLDADEVVFSGTKPGASSTRTAILNNNGSTSVTVTGLELAYGDRGFRLNVPALPVTLDAAGMPGSSIEVDVEFTPSASGSFTDTIVVRESCDRTYLIPLIGGDSDVVSSVPDGNITGVLRGLRVVPNPANSDETSLVFTMAGRGMVSAIIVDAAGREVRRVAGGRMLEAGEQRLNLDLTGLAAGSYLVRVAAGGGTSSAPLIVVR